MIGTVQAVVGVAIGIFLDIAWRALFWSSDAKWSKHVLWRPLTWLEHFIWAESFWALCSYLVSMGSDWSWVPLWVGLVFVIDELFQDHPFSIGSGHERQSFVISLIPIALIALFLTR